MYLYLVLTNIPSISSPTWYHKPEIWQTKMEQQSKEKRCAEKRDKRGGELRIETRERSSSATRVHLVMRNPVGSKERSFFPGTPIAPGGLLLLLGWQALKWNKWTKSRIANCTLESHSQRTTNTHRQGAKEQESSPEATQTTNDFTRKVKLVNSNFTFVWNSQLHFGNNNEICPALASVLLVRTPAENSRWISPVPPSELSSLFMAHCSRPPGKWSVEWSRVEEQGAQMELSPANSRNCCLLKHIVIIQMKLNVP